MRSSMVESPCWLASMPIRPTAICSLRNRIATPTPGACICWMPPDKGSVRRIPSPMPGKACARDKGPPGARHHAMAIYSTSSASEGLANTLSRLAKGATSRRERVQAKIDRICQQHPNDGLVAQLAPARQAEIQAIWLARDIRTLTHWLSHDVLALAGPPLATRQNLFDFIVEELAGREPEVPQRIRPLRVALQNQRDNLLAFAGVLDTKLIV